jgi:hypothetical protein
MNSLTPAMPSNPVDPSHRSRSARWTAGFVVAVGFAFMGSALIDASEPSSHAVGSRPLMAAPTDMDLSGPTAGHAESYEVDAAVRNWVFETRSAEAKPSRSYDFEELWLAR